MKLRGREGTACGRRVRGAPRAPGPGGTRRWVPGGDHVGLRSEERKARRRLPGDGRTPPGPAASGGLPGPGGAATGPGGGSGVGGTLTNFLDLPPSPPVGGSSSGLRPFFLSRVPRPGPRPPPDGSMSRLALATDPAPTPLPPGSSDPAAAAAQQLLSLPPRPASLACRAARAS